jgi:hypothetical protein
LQEIAEFEDGAVWKILVDSFASDSVEFVRRVFDSIGTGFYLTCEDSGENTMIR